MVDELQDQSPQHISSTTKVKGAQGSATLEADTSKEKEITKVHKELESTSGQSVTSV
jgi:hypothetical protein